MHQPPINSLLHEKNETHVCESRASTSAEFPFTFTSMGELTVAAGLDGKGCPGSTAGTVGPSPVANRDKTSPAAVGLDEVTREKSLEWVTAGPLAVVTICGADMGIRWAIQR